MNEHARVVVIGDRRSPKEWVEAEKPVLLESARARVDDILANHFPDTISAELDAEIRERFNILLPVDSTRPTS